MTGYQPDERRRELLDSRVQSRETTHAREMLTALSERGYRSGAGDWVDLADPISASVAGTSLADPALLATRPHAGGGGDALAATVLRTTTVQCALDLASHRADVAVLNFASGQHRGGSWHVGAKAQEEDLVRSSTLLESLDRAAASDEFYAAHASVGPPLGADLCLHTPHVALIRGAAGALLDVPRTVSVLTCAAPIASRLARNDHPTIVEALHRRVDLILATAVTNGHGALVLGAWGCGEYGNDPALVASLFRDALETTYAGAFDDVVFAIRDRSSDRAVERAFTDAFPS